MKRVFKFKKGDHFGGDDDCIYTIFEMLCGDSGMVNRDTKITIISERIPIKKKEIKQ